MSVHFLLFVFPSVEFKKPFRMGLHREFVGWMTAVLHAQGLKHTSCSKENVIVKISGNQEINSFTEAVNYCSENAIIYLSLCLYMGPTIGCCYHFPLAYIEKQTEISF